MAIEEENRLVKDRIDKLSRIKEQGLNPYPYSFSKDSSAKALHEKYSGLAAEEKTADRATVAGRIMQFRKMGKASFMHLQDETGRIQLYFRADDVKNYDDLKLLDLGDIIGASGVVFKTKTGEVTVYVDSFQLLSKSIRPLPEKYHGLQDTELRYRKRYLDLIMNPEVREVFSKRSLIIKEVREFFHKKGFIEVETPTLQLIYGGANARPFITHINAWDMKMYLSISPELYLKRLIVGGFEKVFTICKNFRNEGVDKTHNPEFTMLESYQAWVDYSEMMRLVEECYEQVCLKVHGTTKVKHTYNGQEVVLDFKAPWQRLTMKDALKIHAGVDVNGMDEGELRQLLINYNVELEGEFTKGKAISALFEELVEGKLIQPVHIIDHPKESTPLCKIHRNDPELIERFESYCLGTEVTNAYSELNDPILQRTLLEEQAKELRGGSEEAHPMDEDYVEALEYGLPPTGGLGMGIDRMVIMLTGAESIRDVILFPTMKPLAEDKTVDAQEEKSKQKLRDSLR